MESGPRELLLAATNELNCCAAALLAAGYHTQHMPSGTPEARAASLSIGWRARLLHLQQAATPPLPLPIESQRSVADPEPGSAYFNTAGSQAPSARACVFCIYFTYLLYLFKHPVMCYNIL